MAHANIDLFYKLIQYIKKKNTLTSDQLREYAADNSIPFNLSDLLLGEYETSEHYFERVLDVPPYFSEDHKRVRQMMIDWYSVHRALSTQNKRLVDLFSLDDIELDELLLSFGFPYPSKVINTQFKALLIQDIINLYKKKGTPEALVKILQYTGITNIVLSEWWVHKRDGVFVAEAVPVYPETAVDNATYRQVIPYSTFIEGNKFWKISEAEISTLYDSNVIKLPSLTTQFSLHSGANLSEVLYGLSILHRTIQESYTYWLNYVLKPHTDNILGVVTVIPATPTTGDTYIYADNVFTMGDIEVDETSGIEEYPNYVIKYTGTGWSYTPPEKDMVVLSTETDTHYVYNGTVWVNTTIKFPVSELNNTLSGSLYEPVTLSNFNGTFSILEILLALFYLYETTYSLEDDIGKKYVYYNGINAPLDIETAGIRDDKDDVDYDIVINELETEFDKRIWTYEERKASLESRFQKLTREIPSIISLDNAVQLTKISDIILMAGFYNFKVDIDDAVDISGEDSVISTFLTDLEYYVINAKMFKREFVYTIGGANIVSQLKEVINFFKPYRAYLRDFLTVYTIKDPIGDFLVVQDSSHYFYEDIQFFDQLSRDVLFDFGAVRDSFSYIITDLT